MKRKNPVYQRNGKPNQTLLDLWKQNEKNRRIGEAVTTTSSKTLEQSLKKAQDVHDVAIERKKAADRSRRKAAQKHRVLEKRERLYYLGYNDARTNLWSDSQIDRISWKELKSGKLNLNKHPFLSGGRINYRYKIGKGITVAFNDYTLEHDLSDILAFYKAMSYEELQEALQSICNKLPTADPVTGHGSGGVPGAVTFYKGDGRSYRKFKRTHDEKSEKMKNWVKLFDSSHVVPFRKHKNSYVGWQYITGADGSPHIKSLSKREALIICNAMMYHTTEQESREFYISFRDYMERHCPQIYEVLPDLKYHI